MVMWDAWEHTEHVRNARAGVDRASGFMSETACTPQGSIVAGIRTAARTGGRTKLGGLTSLGVNGSGTTPTGLTGLGITRHFNMPVLLRQRRGRGPGSHQRDPPPLGGYSGGALAPGEHRA